MDSVTNPGPNHPSPGKRVSRDCGVLQTLDSRVATLAAPLYPLSKESGQFAWTGEHQLAFEALKTALLQAPALAIPDLRKPFVLFVDERKGVSRGVLNQTLGPWKWPVAYLSKKLDPVASGWPPCLRAIASTAVLVKDADKLTLGQNVTIVAPHALENIIRPPPDRWMSNPRMTHYQSLLLTERVSFAPPAILNPATLLPEANETPTDRCEEILADETGTRNDLTDQPWQGVANWFTDGSSFMVEVFVDTFSGWVEAFPTRKETANVVTKKIIEEIFPRFGIPWVIGSDNEPAFVAQHD